MHNEIMKTIWHQKKQFKENVTDSLFESNKKINFWRTDGQEISSQSKQHFVGEICLSQNYVYEKDRKVEELQFSVCTENYLLIQGGAWKSKTQCDLLNCGFRND